MQSNNMHAVSEKEKEKTMLLSVVEEKLGVNLSFPLA